MVLSAPRLSTYLHATGQHPAKALELYLWNARVSASFMVPLQLCEIASRNGVVDTLELVHGPKWPWSPGFARSVPHHQRGYSPADDLRQTSRKYQSAGKVVADLKFAFWQHMFTAGQDNRLWLPHFATAFPGYDTSLSVPAARAAMHVDIDKVRSFRNRIAHHEPIFSRNLVTEYERVRQLVEWRRPTAAAWLDKVETVSALIAEKPIP